MKLRYLIILLMFGITSNSALAAAVLDVSYANNDSIFGPSDDVQIRVSVTNTGDMAGSKGGSFLSFGNWSTSAVPPGPYDNLADSGPATTVNPGETITFVLWTILAASAPVPAGNYFAETYVDFATNTSPSTEERFELGEFRWTVSDQTVPAPATLTLLFLGLAGMALRRRKHA